MGKPNAAVADNNLGLTCNAMIDSIDIQPGGCLDRHDDARQRAKAKKSKGNAGNTSRER